MDEELSVREMLFLQKSGSDFTDSLAVVSLAKIALLQNFASAC